MAIFLFLSKIAFLYLTYVSDESWDTTIWVSEPKLPHPLGILWRKPGEPGTQGEVAGVYKPGHSPQALRDFTYWTLVNQTRWRAAIYSCPVTVGWLFFACKLLVTGGEFISISKIRKQRSIHLPADADMLQDVDLLWSVSLYSPEPSENT